MLRQTYQPRLKQRRKGFPFSTAWPPIKRMASISKEPRQDVLLRGLLYFVFRRHMNALISLAAQRNMLWNGFSNHRSGRLYMSVLNNQ